ncbi:unnamed protein product [Lupinus luteus]|uniref:Uncharacterized protein n=1 Tax=Lupinus luteus TaxID=3873 RepID=A0AAV1WFR6_LUPLU
MGSGANEYIELSMWLRALIVQHNDAPSKIARRRKEDGKNGGGGGARCKLHEDSESRHPYEP